VNINKELERLNIGEECCALIKFSNFAGSNMYEHLMLAEKYRHVDKYMYGRKEMTVDEIDRYLPSCVLEIGEHKFVIKKFSSIRMVLLKFDLRDPLWYCGFDNPDEVTTKQFCATFWEHQLHKLWTSAFFRNQGTDKRIQLLIYYICQNCDHLAGLQEYPKVPPIYTDEPDNFEPRLDMPICNSRLLNFEPSWGSMPRKNLTVDQIGKEEMLFMEYRVCAHPRRHGCWRIVYAWNHPWQGSYYEGYHDMYRLDYSCPKDIADMILDNTCEDLFRNIFSFLSPCCSQSFHVLDNYAIEGYTTKTGKFIKHRQDMIQNKYTGLFDMVICPMTKKKLFVSDFAISDCTYATSYCTIRKEECSQQGPSVCMGLEECAYEVAKEFCEPEPVLINMLCRNRTPMSASGYNNKRKEGYRELKRGEICKMFYMISVIKSEAGQSVNWSITKHPYFKEKALGIYKNYWECSLVDADVKVVSDTVEGKLDIRKVAEPLRTTRLDEDHPFRPLWEQCQENVVYYSSAICKDVCYYKGIEGSYTGHIRAELSDFVSGKDISRFVLKVTKDTEKKKFMTRRLKNKKRMARKKKASNKNEEGIHNQPTSVSRHILKKSQILQFLLSKNQKVNSCTYLVVKNVCVLKLGNIFTRGEIKCINSRFYDSVMPGSSSFSQLVMIAKHYWWKASVAELEAGISVIEKKKNERLLLKNKHKKQMESTLRIIDGLDKERWKKYSNCDINIFDMSDY